MVKKKGKKGKSSAADEGGEGQSTAEQYVPLDVPDEVDEFVTLDMRLLNWSYLNFRLKTKTTTRLFSIKNEIAKRHGPITNLKICKDHFAEGNELTDDMLTLHDYGIDGGLTHEKEVVCLIYYDFKPTQHDNPLLLATEQY
ncbi:hypothetical protein H257_08952 [Aphanomyces astaci]|uniref:Ubiquitin-like domain-containing protein n=1 Tax=Aphanomyces astaci TaxID=112090 RepID=W4GBI0_APHAT|nr:hypothetical protein H257_08952 [Aphanomyces astaci]ETV77037.1 hypothetical protein H257_08952 [Aphanomyces astaci]|eukprot:XP_009833343.1 hypothetical protein H257_08952 [Aphanomyces astaci]